MKNQKKILFSLCFLGIMLNSLPNGTFAEQENREDFSMPTDKLSQTIKPGEDFFTYVNEDWIKNAVIPDGTPAINNFIDLYLRNEEILRNIIESILEKEESSLSASEKRVSHLYESYINESLIQSLGSAPIKKGLENISAIKNKKDAAVIMSTPLHGSFFTMNIMQDPKDPKHYALFLGQSGLGLPSEKYYTGTSKDLVSIRSAYIEYIETVFSELNFDEISEKAKMVFDLESKFAQVHWSATEDRNETANYHPMKLDELKSFAPGFDWDIFLETIGIQNIEKMIIRNDSAIAKSAEIFNSASIEQLKAYLTFHYVNKHATILSRNFSDPYFDFFMKKLQGVEKQRPRELRAIGFVNEMLSEDMSKLYINEQFKPSDKSAMESYIPFVKEAFRDRLTSSQWMDAQTKQEAIKKLDAFIAKIGYPEKWHDYDSIVIEDDDLVGNLHRINKWAFQYAKSKLADEFHYWEWEISAQAVNAYYSPSGNEIVFPAGIIQEPFFYTDGDPATNFASICAIIGHEMSHAFDDQGSRYDFTGMLRDWWSEKSRKIYEKRIQSIVSQYETYEILPGLHINGQLTLGENIGDISGLDVAYLAYKKFEKANYEFGLPVLNGLTGDQRFFISWARTWRQKAKDEVIRTLILSDPHSPTKYRVNGVVRNIDAWYEAFKIKEGDAMFLPKEQRINIWIDQVTEVKKP